MCKRWIPCGEDEWRLVCFSKLFEHWEVPARFDPSRRLLAFDCRLEYPHRFHLLLVLGGGGVGGGGHWRGPQSQLSSTQRCGDEPILRASSFRAGWVLTSSS